MLLIDFFNASQVNLQKLALFTGVYYQYIGNASKAGKHMY